MSRSACFSSARLEPGRPQLAPTPLVDRIADAYEGAAYLSGPRLDAHRAGIIAALEAVFRLSREEIGALGGEIVVASEQYDALEDHEDAKGGGSCN